MSTIWEPLLHTAWVTIPLCIAFLHRWLIGDYVLQLRTIYIPRKTEDKGVEGGGPEVKAKKDGGEFDVVIRGLEELAAYLK